MNVWQYCLRNTNNVCFSFHTFNSVPAGFCKKHGLVLIHQITNSSQSDPTTEAFQKQHRLLLNTLLLSYRMNNNIASTSHVYPEANTEENILKASNNNSGGEKRALHSIITLG